MKRGENKNLLFMIPALFVTASVVVLPGINTIYSSFTSWNGFSAEKEFIGLSNYMTLFQDKYFWMALRNNIIWTLLFMTIPVIIGMGVAMLLLSLKKGRNTLQMVMLIPYVLAPIVTAMIWKNIIYSPTSGLVLYLNNLGFQIPNLLTSKAAALYAVAAVDIWHFWSYLMIIYLAALRQVPADQVEAAKLDGAGIIQRFRYVYYPNIRPTVRLLSIMIVIFSFLAFDYVNLMTEGGPAHYTEVLSTLAYSAAFKQRKIGLASATSIIISVFGLTASIIYMRMSRGEERE